MNENIVLLRIATYCYLLTHLLQAADCARLSHEGTVNAIHPPMNTEDRPADDHVGRDLVCRKNKRKTGNRENSAVSQQANERGGTAVL